MEIVESTRCLLWGILKHFYLLLPSLLLDPLDLAARFHVNYDPPMWLVFALLGVGLFVALLVTYHETRMKTAKVSLVIKRLKRVKVTAGEQTTKGTNALHSSSEQLTHGIWCRDLPSSLNEFFSQLSNMGVIGSRLRRNPDGYDENEWVLTSLGQAVIDQLTQKKG